MKVEPRAAAQFLRAPGRYRAVLLHGGDEGLIRLRGAMLTTLVAGSLNDTFRVAELERDGWPKLADEMRAISMVGGRRAIRVRDATDAILEPLKAALKTSGDALIILEAPELGRGKLRPFMEAGPDTASLACFPEDGHAVQETIRSLFHQAGVAVDSDAIAWLSEGLGGNRQLLHAEMDKLILLGSDGRRIDLDLARDCIGPSAASSGEAALLLALTGDVTQADADIEAAIADGLAGVGLIRQTINQLQKLHQARLRMQSGLSASEALKAQRPPVFFKTLPVMLRSLSLWPIEALVTALEDARLVEIACKRTGARPELLARRFIAGLSRQAYARARGRR